MVLIQRGFTLLEVLLVALLMGLTAAAVTLTIGNTDPQQKLQKDALRFIAVTDMLLDEAALTGKFFGLRIEPHSYQYLVRIDDQWSPLMDKRISKKQEFDTNVELDLQVEGLPLEQHDEQDAESWFAEPFEEADVGFKQTEKEKVLPPQIFLFPSGEMSEFELKFTTNKEYKDYQVTVLANSLGQMQLVSHD